MSATVSTLEGSGTSGTANWRFYLVSSTNPSLQRVPLSVYIFYANTNTISFNTLSGGIGVPGQYKLLIVNQYDDEILSDAELQIEYATWLQKYPNIGFTLPNNYTRYYTKEFVLESTGRADINYVLLKPIDYVHARFSCTYEIVDFEMDGFELQKSRYLFGVVVTNTTHSQSGYSYDESFLAGTHIWGPVMYYDPLWNSSFKNPYLYMYNNYSGLQPKWFNEYVPDEKNTVSIAGDYGEFEVRQNGSARLHNETVAQLNNPETLSLSLFLKLFGTDWGATKAISTGRVTIRIIPDNY